MLGTLDRSLQLACEADFGEQLLNVVPEEGMVRCMKPVGISGK
jgi:hypothetical protein